MSDSKRPHGCSLPGSSHGIFQARVLEWGAIASPLLAGVQISTTSENWQHLPKLNTWVHYDPEIPLLGVYLTAIHICVHIKTLKSFMAVVVIVISK